MKNKLNLRKLLMLILCLPLFPIFGIPDGGGSEDDDDGGGAGGADEKDDQGGEQLNEDEIKQKTLNEFLSSIGAKSLDDIKTNMANYQKHLDSQKDETTKAKERETAATTALNEEKQKATMLENKLYAIKNGVKADMVDEFITLVMAKTSDTVTFEKAFKTTSEKFPMFFDEEEGKPKNKGTGNPAGGGKKPEGSNKLSLGERLAQANMPKKSESKYF